MSKKGDDVKHLFAHLGLNPDDYRELNPVNDSDGDESEAEAAADDNWPHVDVKQPAQQAPKNDVPEATDAAPDDAPNDRQDAPAPAAEAKRPPAVEEPPEIRRKPPEVDATPEEPVAAVRDPDPGPERWSLLSRFDDPAGALDDAEIEGIDDDNWPAVAEAPSLPPRVQEEDHTVEDDTARPGVLAKARRLFGASDRDDPSGSSEGGWDEAAPGDSVAEARDAAEAGDAAAEEFWDEVVPQGAGDVDIDAVIARAQNDRSPEPAAPLAPEKPSTRDVRVSAPPPPEPANLEPPAASERPRVPPADDSALGGLMARLRAGPGEREQRTPRLTLELDAPERDTASALEPEDTRLESVFARLKRMRRG